MPNIKPRFETYNPKTGVLTREGTQPAPLAGELLDPGERTGEMIFAVDDLEKPVDDIKLAEPEVPTGDPDVDVAGAGETIKDAEKTIDEPTKTEEQESDILASIADLTGETAKIKQEKADLEKEAGLPGLREELLGINSQIRVRMAEYEAMKTGIEGKPISRMDIIGQQAQIQRAKASEIGILQAQALYAQGKVELAQQTVDRAINLKFSIIESNINTYEAQLRAIEPQLNRDEQKRADEKKRMIEEEKQKIADEKEQEKLEANMAIQGRKFIRDEAELFAIAREAEAMGLNSDDVIIKMPNGDIYKRSPSEIKALTPKAVGGRKTSAPVPEEEPMSINKIEQFRRSYGWTPPFGFSQSQLLKYMEANPDATPEELEAGAKQRMAEIQSEEGGETGEEEFFVDDNYLRTNFSDEELKEMSDKFGTSKWWSGKTKDINRFVSEMNKKIEEARNDDYTEQEILEYIKKYGS